MKQDDIDQVHYDQNERIKEKYLQARYGLWNSLITINGILLGSISIFSLINVNLSLIVFLSLFISGITSLGLLVYNYYNMKDFYFDMATSPFDLTKRKAIKKYRYTNYREYLAIILLFFEILIIFIVLLNNYIGFEKIIWGDRNMELLNFFNNNAGGVQAIFSILLFVATTIYVIINSKMHREMIKERKRYEKPNINLRLSKVISGAYYNLVIENISNVPAKDIVFLEYPSINLHEGITTDSIGFIKNGIKYMGPGQSFESFFLDTTIIESIDSEISFKIKYKNEDDDVFIKETSFNLSIFEHIISLGKPFEDEVIEKLNGIKESIKSI